MIISKVKIKITPLFLLLYFLFAQVYPYLHVHVHVHENGHKHVEFTFHPVDGYTSNHDEAHSHKHGCDHIHSVLEHTVQKVEIKNTAIFGYIVNAYYLHPLSHQELFQNYTCTTPHLFQCVEFNSLRGPPSIC
jgi:hypothetical protein